MADSTITRRVLPIEHVKIDFDENIRRSRGGA